MSEEHITSNPPAAAEGIQAEVPHRPETSMATVPAAPPLTWQMLLTNLGVQAGLALFAGLVVFLILNFIGSEGATARGSGLIAALIALWAARALVHWPIPKATLKARHHLPPNVRPSETGGREVVETVVFVVVLVLLLKSFAAEAFVIPTGSMAETLYGYQKIVTCPTCGHNFPVNAAEEVDPQDGRPPTPLTGCSCTNCRQEIRLVSPRRDRRAPRDGLQREGSTEYVEIEDPGWSSGDRVLVGKFFYDTPLPGLNRPERLDVVVFKYPDGPQKNYTAMNYIKRLIGMPGETIAICGGDLYALDPDKSPKYDDTVQAPLAELWKPEHMHVREGDDARRFFEQAGFRIIQKPSRVLLSMMRLVYDNDHQAKDLPGKEWQRWQFTGDAWESLFDGKAFRHGARADEKESWLRYSHLLRDKKGKPTLITDFMGYNSQDYPAWNGAQWINQPGGRPPNGLNWVGDLILECEVKVEKEEGGLVLELVKGGERFRAAFALDAANPTCSLGRVVKDRVETLETKSVKLGKGTHRLRFANVDGRLTVWVGNTLPFGEGVVYDLPRTGGPRDADLQPASIGVKGASLTVQKLKLFRDSYHTLNANSADVGINDFGDSGAWGDLHLPPVKTLYVQPKHYLCLGDNSPSSSDGRNWGLVPERLLLGRALLVYYPFKRAGRIR